MNIIFFGPPGAGKGTQAIYISEAFSIPQISTGEILRSAIKNKTELGLKVEAIILKGGLVSNEIVTALVKEKLSSEECKKGFILDGFPRTIEQAQSLSEILLEFNKRIDYVLSLHLSDDEVVERITGRRTCVACKAGYHMANYPSKVEGVCDKCGAELFQREDDSEETVRKRLLVYHNETSSLETFYKDGGLLHSFDGSKSIEEVKLEIFALLNKKRF